MTLKQSHKFCTIIRLDQRKVLGAQTHTHLWGGGATSTWKFSYAQSLSLLQAVDPSGEGSATRVLLLDEPMISVWCQPQLSAVGPRQIAWKG